jgi:ketosteroid isomerase-like protein
MLELRAPAAVLTVAALSLLCACQPTPRVDQASSGASEARPLSPADQENIRAADLAFAAAANAGNLDGVIAVYADDAALLPPNFPPQEGREAVRKFWGGLLGAYTVQFDLNSETIEGRGDLAYAVGRYKLSARPKAKGAPPIEEEGKYVEVLKRQSDGSWKYVVDMYSPNSPPKK